MVKPEPHSRNKRRFYVLISITVIPILVFVAIVQYLHHMGKNYEKQLLKKFCSRSCAATYNNTGKTHNTSGFNSTQSYLNNWSNEQIIELFNESNNLSDFSRKLGYKYKISSDNKSFQLKMEELGLNIDTIRKNEPFVETLSKKELFDRYEQWQTARSIIQKKARQIYENSEKPKECVICGYDKHYEVAHIKAVSIFDDDVLISEINNEENLIALCPNHHWEYDNMELDISQYINKSMWFNENIH